MSDAVPTVPVAAAIDADAADWLLDVRETDEWNSGHAPTAHLIPMSELGERMSELPDDRRILVICHSGARSARVTAALRDRGVDAVNVEGGMVAWASAGGAIEADGAADQRN